MAFSLTTEYSGYLRIGGEESLYVAAAEPGEAPWRPPVILVPADAEERTWSQRAMVNLARSVGAAGHPVIRFDFRGQGESDGAFEDTDLGTRAEDLLAVVERVAARYGVAPWLVGLRLGASLAIRFLAERPGAAEGAVAIEPIDSGETVLGDLLRKNLANQLVVHKKVVTNRKDLRDRILAGIPASCNGFLVSRRYLESLVDLDGSVDGARRRAVSILRLEEGAGRDGSEAQPFWIETQTFPSCPEKLFADVAACLPTRRDATAWEDLGLTSEAACGRIATAIQTPEGRVAVTWHPPRHFEATSFLFLNPGPNDRAGPHGLYLRLARALAERGHGVLRVDAIGIGESEGDDRGWQGRPIQEFHRHINDGAMVPSATAALRWLEERHRGGHVLFGLCGGAVNAALTAATDALRDCDLLLLGTPVLNLGVGAPAGWTEAVVKEEVRILGRKLLDPAYLLRLVTFRSDHAHLWRLVRSRVIALVRGSRRAPEERASVDLHPQTNRRFLAAWERHAARGGRTEFVFSEHDRLLGQFREHFAPFARGTSLPDGTRVTVLEGANHNVTERSAEERLLALLLGIAGRVAR